MCAEVEGSSNCADKQHHKCQCITKLSGTMIHAFSKDEVSVAYRLLLAATHVSGRLPPKAVQSLCTALQQLVVEQHQHLGHLQSRDILSPQ